MTNKPLSVEDVLAGSVSLSEIEPEEKIEIMEELNQVDYDSEVKRAEARAEARSGWVAPAVVVAVSAAVIAAAVIYWNKRR